MGALVCIRTYLNRMEAEAIKNLLQANGIMATLVTDDAGGMEPGLTMSNGIKVLVKIEDEETALDLIKKSNGKPVGCRALKEKKWRKGRDKLFQLLP